MNADMNAEELYGLVMASPREQRLEIIAQWSRDVAARRQERQRAINDRHREAARNVRVGYYYYYDGGDYGDEAEWSPVHSWRTTAKYLFVRQEEHDRHEWRIPRAIMEAANECYVGRGTGRFAVVNERYVRQWHLDHIVMGAMPEVEAKPNWMKEGF